MVVTSRQLFNDPEFQSRYAGASRLGRLQVFIEEKETNDYPFDFYIPVLKRSVRYDRVASYFRSSPSRPPHRASPPAPPWRGRCAW